MPATEDDIYELCFWAGRKDGKTSGGKVLTVTLKKYLQGLKAWHLFHNAPYPTASGAKDASEEAGHDSSSSYANELSGRDEADLAILDLALVTFWSLARLGEVTQDPRKGESQGVFPGNVRISSNNSSATMELKESKTARPGESQFLKLWSMPNLLLSH
ncbi:uncharacterized protein PGTG_04194 [Puccinia graminis f. sp. tritici CRL 75-36-700-3]|uniref:Uncharacterized protein n=1 Tax=Puccinia graminis f. sp. tritici (strain CRL 75-36-700-3 / race SCCL) TaxID=418459 RepID=E3K1R3_PUCGT|nr:uncharacterized protein PGTG_04194 [Puccinia graminis f. sp. tritici CRL 75-36-700-3]EFP78238.2 hypothetical protein PGTG_04194 [Puccinia graminis f. sp. tritici CRL 75-36-700-3]